VLTLLGWWQSPPTEIELPSGTHAPEEPQQTVLRTATQFDLNGYQVTPVAPFNLDARVLSKNAIELTEALTSPV